MKIPIVTYAKHYKNVGLRYYIILCYLFVIFCGLY